MKQELKYSVLVAALVALGLAGCQKQEEVPETGNDTTIIVPDSDVPGSEVPAPEAVPESAPLPPSNMNEPPAETVPPPEAAPGTSGAPGEMSDTPPPPAQ